MDLPKKSRPIKVGIIGGTGLYDLPVLKKTGDKDVGTTPFGKPSDSLKIGTINGVECVVLARHGPKHDISPSCVNYRANLWALKQEGCTHVLVTSATGSLQEDYRPGDLVIIDQFIDRTTKREQTFFDGTPGGPTGICHLPMDVPICALTRNILLSVAESMQIRFHSAGTIVVIEGPRFSTKAESHLYRSWNAQLVGMTTVPEAVLAKELGLHYAVVGVVTDYDCWRESHEPVSVEMVMENFRANMQKAIDLIVNAIGKIAESNWDSHIEALENMVKKSTM